MTFKSIPLSRHHPQWSLHGMCPLINGMTCRRIVSLNRMHTHFPGSISCGRRKRVTHKIISQPSRERQEAHPHSDNHRLQAKQRRKKMWKNRWKETNGKLKFQFRRKTHRNQLSRGGFSSSRNLWAEKQFCHLIEMETLINGAFSGDEPEWLEKETEFWGLRVWHLIFFCFSGVLSIGTLADWHFS